MSVKDFQQLLKAHASLIAALECLRHVHQCIEQTSPLHSQSLIAKCNLITLLKQLNEELSGYSLVDACVSCSGEHHIHVKSSDPNSTNADTKVLK